MAAWAIPGATTTPAMTASRMVTESTERPNPTGLAASLQRRESERPAIYPSSILGIPHPQRPADPAELTPVGDSTTSGAAVTVEGSWTSTRNI